jgi:leader peptidase (prepilin peptidase)/N-methyltransferase
MVELLMASLFTLAYFKFGISWTLLEILLLLFGLVTVSFIDLDRFLLPDIFTLSGIVIGLIGGFLNPERSFAESVLGVFLGGGFLWSIAHIYFLIRKEEGMGGGDIKLLAWLGAVLGWKAIPFIILSSSLLGSFVGIALAMRSRKGMKTVIPFGPYLALGAVIYIFVGESLAELYLQLFIPGLS